MGYSEEQRKDLADTINASDADVVVVATPIDLRKVEVPTYVQAGLARRRDQCSLGRISAEMAFREMRPVAQNCDPKQVMPMVVYLFDNSVDILSDNIENYSFDQFAGLAAFDSLAVPGNTS